MQAVHPYSLHLRQISVGLLVLPCTRQCRRSTLTPSTCYRFRSNCSYSLVPASAGGPPLLPPPATDSGRTARTPLYPPVQAVHPYSLHLRQISVGLLVLPCTRQCRRSTLTPSTCYRFRSDCSYSLVPASAGGPPLLPPPATDSGRTARTPLYPPVQAVHPYSLHLRQISVGLLVLPCTRQCRRSTLTPSTCDRFWSDCSYSLVPASAGGPPLLPPPATDSGRTARTPLYPPVQAVHPYSLHLRQISVGLLVLPCTRQCRRSTLIPSTCDRFRSDCSYSLVPASAGSPPLLPPPATDFGRTARTPLYPPVQAVHPYSLHLLQISVGLLVLPCTRQCRRSTLIPSTCDRFRSDCSYSLVPASAGSPPLLPPPATDFGRTARTPLYPPVQAVHPYSLHLRQISVGLLVLPCTRQCRQSTLTPSTCYRFRSDCSYSLVPASAGGPPLLPPPATDSGRTARTPLYPPVQAVHPYSLHLRQIPVGLLVLPCTRQCRRSTLTPSTCDRFRSDCSYSLVPASAGSPPLLPPPATDFSRTARTPLYPPVQAVHPYSLHLRLIPVGLLVLPCTRQCRRSPLTPSTCDRFRSDCSYSLVPASAGGPPLLPPPATDFGRTARTPLYPPVQAVHPYSLPLFFSCPGQRNQWKPVSVPVTGVHYHSLLWMCTLNTLTWPDLRKFVTTIYLHPLKFKSSCNDILSKQSKSVMVVQTKQNINNNLFFIQFKIQIIMHWQYCIIHSFIHSFLYLLIYLCIYIFTYIFTYLLSYLLIYLFPWWLHFRIFREMLSCINIYIS